MHDYTCMKRESCYVTSRQCPECTKEREQAKAERVARQEAKFQAEAAAIAQYEEDFEAGLVGAPRRRRELEIGGRRNRRRGFQ
jgi:hypothetical protein